MEISGRETQQEAVCVGGGRVRWSVLTDGQLSILEIT